MYVQKNSIHHKLAGVLSHFRHKFWPKPSTMKLPQRLLLLVAVLLSATNLAEAGSLGNDASEDIDDHMLTWEEWEESFTLLDAIDQGHLASSSLTGRQLDNTGIGGKCKKGGKEFNKRGGADQKPKCNKAKRCYKKNAKKMRKYRCRHVAQKKRRCNDRC